MKVLILDWFNIVKRYLYNYNVEEVDMGELIDTMTFSVLNKLCDVYKATSPDLLFICSDSGYNRRAKAIISDYKGNRKKGKTLSEEEKENSYVEFIKNVANTLPCPFIEVKDTEADMIIRCVINYLHNIDDTIKITIASSDSDFIQLLSKNVSIYDWYKGNVTVNNWYTLHKKHDKYLNSKNYAIGKAITGDSSDNIDGVKNWGWKKVTRLFDIINQYYDDDIIFDNILNLKNCVNEINDNNNMLNKSDKNFISGAAEMIKINSDLIVRNMSVIDLDMVETPYLYKIYSNIERQLYTNKQWFNKNELLSLMQLGRYGANDPATLKKLIDKNSKAMFIFYGMAGKANNAITALKTKKNK